MSEATCSVEGCLKQAYARKLCHTHYRRWRLYGTTTAPSVPRMSGTLCSVEGCEQLAHSRGMCGTHYRRWRLYGSTDERPIQGRPAVRPFVVFQGTRYYQKDNGHWRSSNTVKRRSEELGRAVYEHSIGPIPVDFHIHHIDGNPDNNEPSNLEALSAADHGRLHKRTRTANCDNCGRQFLARGPKTGLTSVRWCSRACATAAWRRGIARTH